MKTCRRLQGRGKAVFVVVAGHRTSGTTAATSIGYSSGNHGGKRTGKRHKIEVESRQQAPRELDDLRSSDHGDEGTRWRHGTVAG
ncbi:hypothetical protein PIB30_087883 [Stylosanthes scabra]|uniref:Secreted protein n=1 Tax=Stylosanthes scabra TaxID=79078 RepID=A0ABU6VS88_9FABA|nr:hypothetical protein [Stylosanthes scabra]